MFTVSLDLDISQVEKLAETVLATLSKPDLSGEPARIISSKFKGLISSGKFVPVTQATRSIRSKRGQAGRKPLKVTGRLQQSISIISSRGGELVAGSKLRKAALLRFGGATDGASMIPGKRVPRRDYMFVDEALLEEVAKSVLSRLE